MPLVRNDKMTYEVVDIYRTPSNARFNWLIGNQTLASAGFNLTQAQTEFQYFWQRWQALGRSGSDFLLLNCMDAAINDAIWSGHAASYSATCQSRVNVIVPPGRYQRNYPQTVHFGGFKCHGSSEFYTNGADYGGTFGQGGTSFWKNRAGWLGSQSLRVRATTGSVAANPSATVSQVVPVTDATWDKVYVNSRFLYPDKSTTGKITAKGGSPGTRTITIQGDLVNRGFPILSNLDILHSEEMNMFQSGTWGDPNLFGYNEAFQYEDFRVVGNTDEDVYNPEKEDAAMAIWDMGSGGVIRNVFTDDFYGGGFHFARGTYCSLGDSVCSFRHMRYAIYLQGGGQISVAKLETDECPAAFLAEAGYDRPSYFTGSFEWTKIETGEAPSRPVSKGTMLFDVHGAGSLTFLHVQYAAVNSMPNCLARFNCDMDNDGVAIDNPSSSVKIHHLQCFGPIKNIFHDVFHRVKYVMHGPGGDTNYNGYWGTQMKDFFWISTPIGRGSSTWFTPNRVNNVAPGRLEPLAINPSTGNIIGSWNEVAGTPVYTHAPAAGPVSNPPPTPVESPFAANAVVTMSAPVINVGQTSQATVAVFDQFGASFPSTGGVWGILSGSGSISTGGLFTSTGPGATVVSFTLGGSSWYAQVNVNAVTPPAQIPTTVNVTVPLTTLQVGLQMQAQYQVLDQNDVPMSATGLWTVQAGTASINASTGVVIPGAPGTITVRLRVGGPTGPFGEASFTATAVPVTQDPTTVVVTLPQSTLASGSTMQASVSVLDQNGQPMAASGSWSIVVGPATINPVTGLITGTGAGNATVKFTVTDGPEGQATFLGTVVVVPPTPTPLFDLTFQGQNPANLPGMVPVTQDWKRGAISGAVMTTTINTIQKHAAPIAGVRRIVLTGLTMKENAQDKWLNNRVRTNATRRFVLDTPAATAQDPVISPAFTVGVEGNLTITFATPQTITHLFGGSDSTYYTSLLGVKRVQYWSTP